MTDTHVPPNFEGRLLHLLAAPRTAENVRFLTAWRLAEGGVAEWDPLNATYKLPYGESWNLAGNTAGVQSYFKPVAGICATALMLIQTTAGADFAKITGDLQAGKYTAEELVARRRTEISEWGTNPDHILALLKGMP